MAYKNSRFFNGLLMLVGLTVFLGARSSVIYYQSIYKTRKAFTTRSSASGGQFEDDHQVLTTDFKAYVSSARQKLGCRNVQGDKSDGTWPPQTLSLDYFKLPPLLPNYRNPCWRADGAKVQCWPTFFLAGFPKCGSTDLFRRLIEHPLVVSGITKEPHFWARTLRKSKCFKLNKEVKEMTRCLLNEYSTEFFKNATSSIQHNAKRKDVFGYSFSKHTYELESRFQATWHKIRQNEYKKIQHPFILVDGSTSTAWDNSAWRHIAENQGCHKPVVGPVHLIRKIHPAVKVAVILRDPTDRLYSDYLDLSQNPDLSRENFHLSVIDAINKFKTCRLRSTIETCALVAKSRSLASGIYHAYLSNLVRVIPAAQLMVIHAESYYNNIAGTMTQLFRFLDLPPVGEEAMAVIANLGAENVSKKKSNVGETMLPKTEAVLRRFYAEHNEMLADLLQDQRFAWRREE